MAPAANPRITSRTIILVVWPSPTVNSTKLETTPIAAVMIQTGSFPIRRATPIQTGSDRKPETT